MARSDVKRAGARDGDKPTAERILDAAEQLFAERGYEATSLGDLADRVGIRQPSLYNHFRNKQELYVAVFERLLDPFHDLTESMVLEGSGAERVQKLIYELMGHYTQHPNLVRLIQHAVLAGDDHLSLLVERWFRPFLERARVLTDEHEVHPFGPELRPFATMAFNSMMMGYVTLAPLYRQLLEIEPLSHEATQLQIQLLDRMVECVVGPRRETA